MNITPDQITIAVTVFDRRQYLRQSVGSAMAQTLPVRVMVVEDCGPDSGLKSYVQSEFGPAVGYFRNPARRGIFGNWNSCIEQCQTRWLSILHDDDWLLPGFAEAMIELNREAGERGLYFGRETVVDDLERPLPEWNRAALDVPWRPITPEDFLFQPLFSYPGQLIDAHLARKLGGFRETSLYCGDWEFWIKLTVAAGGAETARQVGVFRSHSGWDRGTNRVLRSGKPYGLISIQRKRNLALKARVGVASRFDRNDELTRSPMPATYLLSYAAGFSRMYLRYNTARLCRSAPPHWRYAVFQALARLFGPGFVRAASRGWNTIRRRRANAEHSGLELL
ncbi:MAG TPA: glycosyltransferase [Verrucomicrobiae bacterium]|nr:glycosyltransferase [Verrucomicrobiae bacterium]